MFSNLDYINSFKAHLGFISMLSQSDIPLEERTDILPRHKKLWRVLARVESIGENNGLVGLVIPSWKSEETVKFPLVKFPVELVTNLKPEYIFHTYANLGAENASELYIDINRHEMS